MNNAKCLLILMIMLSLVVNISSQSVEEKSSDNPYSVILPSPAAVHLNPGGRFDIRYNGNSDYLRYQYDY